VVCRNVFEAERSRQHNNANVLCLGSDTTVLEQAKEIVKSFLGTSFEGGRHQKRLDKITEMERPV
jgi:ribose 5-phosphate isomerase B